MAADLRPVSGSRSDSAGSGSSRLGYCSRSRCHDALSASSSEHVAEHATAVVNVGGQRPVAGGAARFDLGEAALVE